MSKTNSGYDICSNKKVSISLELAQDIVKDIALRAQENGNTIELEFSLRLARSLERDLEMICEDNTQALQAFNKKGMFSTRKNRKL